MADRPTDDPPPDAPRRAAEADALKREAEYYRREYNEIGARLLRLQEEQGRTLREAKRSRTLAALVREAYRRADRAATPAEVGLLISEILLESLLCDRAAILRRLAGDDKFAVLYAMGFDEADSRRGLTLADPPAFLFTTAHSDPEPAAAAMQDFVQAPYVLWAYAPDEGYALLVGNRSEGNVSRPYEPGDRALIEGALSVYVDMLARKQRELDLRSAKLEAEEAGRAQARFLAKLSHELRTPLNAILGFSEMLGLAEQFAVEIEDCVDYAKDINSAGNYLLALIEDILDFSAYGQETPALHDENVDVLDLMTKAYDNVRPMAEAKRIGIRIDLNGRVPDVRADPIRMRQVLVNLLSNAVKFTPAGGAATATARLDLATGSVVIDVADNGIGMQACHIPKVFEPFVQVHDRIDYANDGVGLGLTIAKALVEAHEGVLTLESAPDQGVTARITLPPSRTARTTSRSASAR